MSDKSSSHRITRRDFMKATIAAVGGFIGLTTSIPAVAYLLSPALRENKATGWIDLGSLEK